MVPEPTTRVARTPPLAAKCAARWVMMSTGFETTASTASGACSSTEGTTAPRTAAFRSRSWSRVSPGFWATPAAITTTRQPTRSA